VVVEVQHTHQGPAQVEEHVFQDFCTLSCNYLLQGKPFNETRNTTWKIRSWVEEEMKLDKVECKWNWKGHVEALMSTTRPLRDDNVGRRNWKVSRWILCLIQKGKPLRDSVIVFGVVQLKNTPSFDTYLCCESVGKIKLPLFLNYKKNLVQESLWHKNVILVWSPQGQRKPWWNSKNVYLFHGEFGICPMHFVDHYKLWMNFEVVVFKIWLDVS
jgi:hypothetical protein